MKDMVLTNTGVQSLIKMLVDDTIRERDRTVSIRIDPDGAISINIYPMTDDGGE